MCNHYSSDGAWRDKMGEFSQLRLPVFDRLRPRPNVQGPDIWPGYTAEILRVEGEETVAHAATWLLIPFWFKGSIKQWRRERGGCNNAKGETADTSGIFKQAAKTGRCLIPGDAFFEYGKVPGPDGKKIEYRFTPVDGRPFFFAGLCGRAEPEEGPMLTFTMVTKPGGGDTLSIGHPRQPVILRDDELADWVAAERPVSDFLSPSSGGTFGVEAVTKRAG